MNARIFLRVLPLMIWACGTQAERTTADAASDTSVVSTGNYAANAAPAPLPGLPACYLYIDGKDTLLLRLRKLGSDGEINGDLDMRSKGKESTNGSFFGKMVGDTLFANYSYLQKEKRKVKEVAFLRRGDGWLEGKGPSAEQSGIRRYTDHRTLTFSNQVYQNVTCQ